MLLRLQVAGPARSGLRVPAEAVIRTGTRTVVIVRKDSGAFEPRNVRLGADLGDTVEVTRGLDEGEQVVASGQFLIDSEASMRSAIDRMAPADSSAASTPAAAPTAGHVDQGQVGRIDGDAVTMSHGPVAPLPRAGESK